MILTYKLSDTSIHAMERVLRLLIIDCPVVLESSCEIDWGGCRPSTSPIVPSTCMKSVISDDLFQ